jgi:hypothetical protein
MSFSWVTFWKYFQWSLDFLMAWPLWLVTLALVINLGLALARQRPFRQRRWKSAYWLVFASYLFIPVMLAIGVIAAVDSRMVPRRRPNELAVWASDGLFVASLLLGIFCSYKMKGLRWLATAISLLQLWILLSAGFIAGMALSGDWL